MIQLSVLFVYLFAGISHASHVRCVNFRKIPQVTFLRMSDSVCLAPIFATMSTPMSRTTESSSLNLVYTYMRQSTIWKSMHSEIVGVCV